MLLRDAVGAGVVNPERSLSVPYLTARLIVPRQVLGKAEAAALAGSAEVVRTTLVTAGAVTSGRVPVGLAQKPGGKVSGLLNAERLMVAKQLEQHFSMNGAATGAVLDSKVTGGWVWLSQGRTITGCWENLEWCCSSAGYGILVRAGG